MFTSWDQVKDWITDNNFSRWIFYKNNPQGGSDNEKNFKIIDSAVFTVSDQEDKLAMSEKYLRLAGGRCWAVGTNRSAGETIAEIRLETEQPAQGAQGVGGLSIGELTETITKQVRAEMEAQRYRDERTQFEKDKAAFEEEKKSAMGALVHYLAPIGQMMMQKKMGMPMVAGVDVEQPVHTAPIVPDKQPENEEQQEDVFTDEEEAQIFDLLSRFKKIEPDYLKLLKSVVEMAENGDATYTMAKGFLVK